MQGGGVFIPRAAGFFCVPSVFFGFGKVYWMGGGKEYFSCDREERLLLQARWFGLPRCTGGSLCLV